MLLVWGDVDAHLAEAFAELDEVDKLVTVLVKPLEQVDGVVLHVVVLATSLDLVDQGTD